MHSLPRVRELAERFSDTLTVIGVHSGKFPAERATERIRTATERLGVTHPVVNDRQFRVWRAYGVTSWPTIALVSPDGYVLTTLPGEFAFEEVAGILERAVAAYSQAGLLRRGPSPFPGIEFPDTGALRFPGRVLAHEDRLYVSDTGHHRVVRLRLLEGRACPATGPVAIVESVWGAGIPGFMDGEGEHVFFNEPQGLALIGGRLYVADRANHAIRCVDLAGGRVETVAGTGKLGDWGIRPGPGLSTSMRSPWGLAPLGDDLLIAMAGSHQLWSMALDGSATLSVAAGTGAEALEDGPADRAALAQPTGVVEAGGGVYFTDAESSAVRHLGSGSVDTIVGTGLFDFGDRDGAGTDVLLQHPENLTWWDDRVFVTDTYNDKIKTIDPVARTCEALPGEAGSGDGLSGPTGISASEECLFVADTDAHRIAVIDVGTGAARTLEID